MSVNATTDAERVVSDLFEAMRAGDGDRVGALLAEDVTWTFPGTLPWSGQHVGKEAVFSDLLAVTGPYFEPGNLGIEMHNLLSDGGLVVAEYTGRNLTKTGRQYENEYVFVVEVADGLIRHIRTYGDTLYMKDTILG
jgi:ketosteroid isomerase-like protein